MTKITGKLIAMILAVLLSCTMVACSANPSSAPDAETPAPTDAPALQTSEQPQKAKAVEIEFWCFSDWATGPNGDLTKEFVKEFEAANPGVTIKVVGKPDTEIQAGIVTGAGSGVLPDAFVAAYNVGNDLVKTGVVKDVAAMWNALGDDYKSQFQKSAVDGLNINGQIWGIPITAYDTILYRNLDVLKQAGIDPEKGITDWADWLSQMKAVKAAGFDALSNYSIDGWAVMSFLGGVDGVANSLKDGKTTLTVAQFEKAYTFMSDMKPYCTDVGCFDQAATDLFIANRMAFHVMGPWANTNFAQAKDEQKLNYDFIAIPGEVAGKTGGVHGGEWLGITEGDNADIAFKWIAFFADKAQVMRMGSQIGRLSFNTAAMADPSVQENKLITVCSQALQGGMADAAYFMPFPLTIRQPIADNASAVLAGKKTPAQAAADSIDGINAAIAEAE